MAPAAAAAATAEAAEREGRSDDARSPHGGHGSGWHAYGRTAAELASRSHAHGPPGSAPGWDASRNAPWNVPAVWRAAAADATRDDAWGNANGAAEYADDGSAGWLSRRPHDAESGLPWDAPIAAAATAARHASSVAPRHDAAARRHASWGDDAAAAASATSADAFPAAAATAFSASHNEFSNCHPLNVVVIATGAAGCPC